jgi:hypothetical protein
MQQAPTMAGMVSRSCKSKLAEIKVMTGLK